MQTRGFTLIELIIAMAIPIGIGILVIAGISQGGLGDTSNRISFGVNGVVETRCVDGYKFMMGHDGSARQIMDEYGHGVRCR